MGQPITPQMFGALGDGSHNDCPALQNAINAALGAGRDLYIPTGTYNLVNATGGGPPLITVDLSKLTDPVTGTPSLSGITIYGDGANSNLQFNTGGTPLNASALTIYSSTATSTSIQTYFYFNMRNLQIAAGVNGANAVLQIGSNSQYDQLNACQFTGLVIAQGTTPANACFAQGTGYACLINSLFQSTIEGVFDSNVVGNCTLGQSGGGGQAGLKIVGGQFNRISCSPSASIYNGYALWLTGLHSSGSNAQAQTVSNVFLSPDLENCQYGVWCDSDLVFNNVFVAPYFVQSATPTLPATGPCQGQTCLTRPTTTAMAWNAGSNNRIITPYYNNIQSNNQLTGANASQQNVLS